MGKLHTTSGIFDSEDLRLLAAVNRDVCFRICEEGRIELTPHLRDTIAASIFRLAAKGERDPEILWCLAMRDVEARNGFKPARV